MDEAKKIALLYFSRSAELEGRKKAWFSSGAHRKNRTLASSLIIKSLAAVRRSGFPVFHYHEGLQRGRTFGERLANAYQDIFEQGYTAVIAVGNDTPEIARIDWRRVGRELSAGSCVLGPTLRAGAYLIGITAEAFDRERFQQLPWQSHRLLDALADYCTLEEQGPVFIATLRDLNGYRDLKKLVQSATLDAYLKRLILFLLYCERRIIYYYHTSFLSLSPLLGDSPLRAPPSTL